MARPISVVEGAPSCPRLPQRRSAVPIAFTMPTFERTLVATLSVSTFAAIVASLASELAYRRSFEPKRVRGRVKAEGNAERAGSQCHHCRVPRG